MGVIPDPDSTLVVLDHELRVVRGWKINSTGDFLSPNLHSRGLPSFVVFSVCSAAGAGGVAVRFAD